MSSQKVILLLGSNIGDKKNNINRAICALEKLTLKIENITEYAETVPIDFASNNYFCNIALSLSTDISPISLLKAVKEIEKNLGRERDSGDLGYYADRVVDIDIVFYGNLQFWSPKLTIPHEKNAFERDFSKELIAKLNN